METYRRIEVHIGSEWVGASLARLTTWSGLPSAFSEMEEVESLEKPKHYFTNFGWEKFGKQSICELREKRFMTEFRILECNACSFTVHYADEYQVCGWEK